MSRRALAFAAALLVVAGATAAGILQSGADSVVPARGAPVPPRFRDVAVERGLVFRHAAFRHGVTLDPVAMTGGGLCWLDYDEDGWLDLFVVNAYSADERDEWLAAGGLPTSRLFRNTGGRFVDVTATTGAGLAARGQGCVAADLDVDRHTDLFVTTSEFSALLWNDGNGRFTQDEAVKPFGWHTGASAGDLNGDGLPELFAAGYVDMNRRIPGATLGFPNIYRGARDLLFLNEGERKFREVGAQAGLEVVRFAYGLGALMSDFNRDGDLDLYVANDTNPNRLYENVAWPGGADADPDGLGFRFEERAAAAGVADAGSGMGVAAGDYDGDGGADLFVTNARRQVHAVYRSFPPDSFVDVRDDLGPDFTGSTGWGVSWADFDLDADLDLFVANGNVPVTDLRKDAQRLELFEQVETGRFRSRPVAARPLLARGSAAADYDNDGDLDVAVAEVGRPLVLLENTESGGNWLEVQLEGFHPGAEVTVRLPGGRVLLREAQAGSSYLSSEDPRCHFGLGSARTVRELVVRWPGGAESSMTDVAANRLVKVEAPS